MPPSNYAEGYARRIPAGSKPIFQVHCTPNGSEQLDTSSAGLVFIDPANPLQNGCYHNSVLVVGENR